MMTLSRLMLASLVTALMLGLSATSSQAQGGDAPPWPGQAFRFEQLAGDTRRISIIDIAQDKQGFLWFGGSDGLYRYDGYRTTVYRHDPNNPTTLSGNWVQAVLVDSQGNLWAGTRAGLSRFDPQTQRFIRYQHNPDDPHSLSENRVQVLLEDSRGNLWVGTRNGLNRFDRETGQFVIYSHNPDNPNSLSHSAIGAIAEDAQGALWIVTQNGVNKMVLAADGIAQITRYQHNPDDPHSLSENFAVSILVDSQNDIWIGTWGGGLNYLAAAEREKTVPRFIHYQHQPDNPHSLGDNIIIEIFEDSQGALWLGTYRNGLQLFDRRQQSFRRFPHDEADPNSLSGNTVASIFEDSQGLLWVGMEAGGVNKFDRRTLAFGHHRHDPGDPQAISDAPVLAFTEDAQGDLWLATVGDGLNHLLPGDESHPVRFIRHGFVEDDPTSLSSDVVKEIIRDSRGRLWIATEDGLNQLLPGDEPDKARFIRYQHDPNDPASLSVDNIETIFEDSHGTLWVGTFFGGLNQLLPGDEPEKARFIHYKNNPDDPASLSSNIVYDIYEDSQGVLWLGTRGGGLNKMVPGDTPDAPPRFIHYQPDERNPRSLSSTTVYDLFEDSQGRFWVGTWGGGLQQLNRASGEFIGYPEADGFSDHVYNILEDEQGYLWLNTQKGIARFDPASGSFTHYDETNGIVTFYEGRAYRDRRGNFYFGGLNGFNVFQPAQIPENHLQPRLLLTDFRLFNDPVPMGGGSLLQKPIWETDYLTLSYADSIVSFEFAALDYLAPEKIRYQYKLEGYEAAWNEVGSDRRYSTYTNLPAGDYTFKVRSTNSAGLWSDNEVALTISVLPPWWQTAWFRGSVVVALVGLAFGTYRLRVRIIEQRNRELEAQVAGRTIELSEANTRLTQTQADLHRRIDQLAALNKVGATIAATLEIEQAIGRILEELKQVAPYDSASVQILREGYLEIVGEYVGDNTSKIPGDAVGLRFPVPGDNPNTVVVETRRAYHLPDAPAMYDIFLDELHQPIRSWLGVPLIAQNEIIGILALDSYTPNYFDEDTIDLATTFADQAAIAIKNARLFEAARQSQEKAEIASQAKSTFLANMSHELRSPLNVILGFAQVMQRSQTMSPDDRENLDIITRSGEHLLSLINQILDLSKIEAGRTALSPNTFDLYRLLNDLESMFSLSAQAKDIYLHIERSDALPRYILSDELKLRQVLINLLSNAVKFTERGGVTLRVDSEENHLLPTPNSLLLSFEVEDTGPGIAPKEIDTLFEAFTQARSSQPMQEGTGLGLPISQKFIQLLGGELKVQSEVGRGATFRFYIAVEQVEAGQYYNQRAKSQQRPIALESGQPDYRILVVDDRWENRQFLLKLLEPLGFTLREAENGRQALEIWETFGPQLIFMDIRMPIMDGYEATQRIKATIKGQATVIIAVTASAFEEERAVVLSAGCDDFLRKPFREADLFTLLEQHLGAKFVYAQTPKMAAALNHGQNLSEMATALTGLPAELWAKLKQAAATADIEEVEAAIDQIQSRQPALADELARLAHAFDYDQIVALLSKQERGAGSINE